MRQATMEPEAQTVERCAWCDRECSHTIGGLCPACDHVAGEANDVGDAEGGAE